MAQKFNGKPIKRLQGRLEILFGSYYSNILDIGIQSTGVGMSSILFRVHTKRGRRQFNLMVEPDGRLWLKDMSVVVKT